MNKIIGIIKILKKEKYLMIFMSVSLVLSAVFYYLNLLGAITINNFLAINGLAFTLVSFSLSFFTSILIGFYLTLFVYKYDLVKEKSYKNTTGSFLGGVFGVLGAGCPGCSFTVLSILGIPFGLAVLPFKGLELKFAGVFALIASNYFLAKNIDKKICIPKK